MSKLPHPKERPSIFVVAESCLLLRLSLSTDTDFEFMFTPRVCNYFPIMDALIKANITIHCPKNIVILLQIDAPLIYWNFNFLWYNWSIPIKLLYNNSNNFPLQSQVFHLSLYVYQTFISLLFWLFTRLLLYLSLFILFFSKIVIYIFQNFLSILIFECLLEQKHFIAYIVTDLNSFIFNFKFFATSISEDSLTLTVSTFLLFAPLFMFINCWE